MAPRLRGNRALPTQPVLRAQYRVDRSKHRPTHKGANNRRNVTRLEVLRVAKDREEHRHADERACKAEVPDIVSLA